jgi:hypothetical protein
MSHNSPSLTKRKIKNHLKLKKKKYIYKLAGLISKDGSWGLKNLIN